MMPVASKSGTRKKKKRIKKKNTKKPIPLLPEKTEETVESKEYYLKQINDLEEILQK